MSKLLLKELLFYWKNNLHNIVALLKFTYCSLLCECMICIAIALNSAISVADYKGASGEGLASLCITREYFWELRQFRKSSFTDNFKSITMVKQGIASGQATAESV